MRKTQILLLASSLFVDTPEKILKNMGAGNLTFPAPFPQLFIPQRDSI